MATTTKRARRSRRPGVDSERARQTVDRMNESLEAAQKAGKALRGDLSKGSRDLLKEIEKMMAATRKDVAKLSKAVRADLADLQKAIRSPEAAKPKPRAGAGKRSAGTKRAARRKTTA